MLSALDTVVLKITNRCNLNCSYCYIYNHEDHSFVDRPGFMSDDVYRATLETMNSYCKLHDGRTMSLVFHGGEPTLIGPQRFDKLACDAETHLGSRLRDLAIQTNATLINREWIDVLRRHNVLIGVSLDGPENLHDIARVDHAGRGSHKATERGLLLLQDAGLQPGVLCVVNPEADGDRVYAYFQALGVTNINFLFPDVSHDNKGKWYGRLGQTPVADFLIPVFDAWFAEDNPNIRIPLFWDLLRGIFGGKSQTEAFGNWPSGYLVVETDGAIEANDALRVCAAGIAHSGLNVINHGFHQLRDGLPLVYQIVTAGLPLCETCRACHECDICGGGHIPHRFARRNGFDNPSVWCSDILKLISHIRQCVGAARAKGASPANGEKRQSLESTP